MKVVVIFVLTILLTFSSVGCTHSQFEDTRLDVPQIMISSDSIDETGKLLDDTTADKKPNNPLGSNQSPQLTWDTVDQAAYYAVCMFDEDANWLHWIVLDLEKTQLQQGEYTAHSDYIGPYPPKDSEQHNYIIEVFALKRETDHVILKLDARQSYSGIVRYLNRSGNNENNILARGYIMGSYKN